MLLIHAVYLDGHCFMQDNDPKHCSKLAKAYYKTSGINWWTTPPESPDLNPIENLSHELKENIWCQVKPRSKEELISGIKASWATVTVAKYIGHLLKVIQKSSNDGATTGY